MRNFKCVTLAVVILLLLLIVPIVRADTVTDNAINYLKSQQDSSGRITNGFSAPSQWSAIAFTANGVDVSTVKNPENSLMDFLLADVPLEPSAATDWESRILAIVAIGADPTNFGGVNYLEKLQAFHNNNQLGDICSLNDDIFGLLALIASGNSASTSIKQDVLNFIIEKQDPADGGFGFSAPVCDWYSTSADMTGAALQALQVAKDTGLTNANLDTSIENAKNYLLSNQNPDRGFGYFGTSDTDTTGWVLMAFNVAGMGSSTQAESAKNWLISQQSETDGGILALDWGSGTFVSNSTTTAQALIALSGKGWILKIFTPQSTSASTPTASSSPSPSPASNSTPTPTPSPMPSPSPTPTVLGTLSTRRSLTTSPSSSPTPSPSPQVLGEKETDSKQTIAEGKEKSNFRTWATVTLLIIGVLSLGLFSYKTFLKRTN